MRSISIDTGTVELGLRNSVSRGELFFCIYGASAFGWDQCLVQQIPSSHDVPFFLGDEDGFLAFGFTSLGLLNVLHSDCLQFVHWDASESRTLPF